MFFEFFVNFLLNLLNPKKNHTTVEAAYAYTHGVE